MKRLLSLVVVAPALALAADAVELELHLDPTTVQRKFEPQRLSGTNIALWVGAQVYQSPEVERYLRESGIQLVRIPGGSWSDIVFWNGNGVRDPQTGRVDRTKMKDGYPAIDYSAYAPTITVEDKPPHAIRDWHGNVDVKTLHDYVQKLGAQTLVCVNAGTGRPVDAAEWVRFANKTNDYGVRYWEIGNELDGTWEAGHFLPDGSRLTAGMYAQRFADFAKAMKAVDGEIRIGGPASGAGDFAEAILRDAGEQVDYVSLHTYPGNPLLSTAEQFKRVKAVRDDVALVRKWIEQYQPGRKGQIEIGYTEWNLPATRVACELTNGLWTALFLREMAVEGVDFATQWDAFTQGADEEGGHALMMTFTEPPTRKSQYWSMAMWNQYVGPDLLAAGTVGGVEYMTTRRGGEMCVMLVNTSEDTPARVRFTGVPDADWMETSRLSVREYLWNPIQRRPAWNTGPTRQIVDMPAMIELPPFSLTYVRVPEAGADRPELPAPTAASDKRALRIIAPESAFANEEVELIVTAVDEKGLPSRLSDAAKMTVMAGEQQIGVITLDEPARTLRFRPATAGELEIRVAAGEQGARHMLTVKSAEPQPVVIWDAEEKVLSKEAGYESDWKLTRDETVRANQPVVRIDVSGNSTDGNPVLLRLSQIPERVNRDGIRGVFFDLKSDGLRSTDPQARIDVVVQSEADWWMHLGSIPVKDVGDWKRFEFPLKEEKHIRAAKQTRNIWLVLRGSDPAGTVYFDKVGFMVR